MTNRSVRLLTALGAVAVACGCSGTDAGVTSGEGSRAPAPDVSALDTGPYSTSPRTLGTVASIEEGKTVEAWRMGELIPDFRAVDPSLTSPYANYPLLASGDAANAMSLSATDGVQRVLERYAMVAAYFGTQSNDKGFVSEDSALKPNGRVVKLVVVRFPDAEAAQSAALEIDAADFAASDDTVAVPIEKYPDARGHWRPTVAAVSSTLAHGEFVLHTITVINTEEPLVQPLKFLAEKAFAAAIPLIDAFEPTPVDQLATMPRDPDGLLGRVLDLDPGREPAVSTTFTVVGPRVLRFWANPHDLEMTDAAGIDRRAAWIGTGGSVRVLRARDSAGAKTWFDDPADPSTVDRQIEAPKGVPANCNERSREYQGGDPSLRYTCEFVYDRYVGWVSSDDENDVRLRAAAQYALLVNAL